MCIRDRGQTVIKGTARKVRRLNPGGHAVVAGFAGSTADAFTLLERLEKKLEAAPGQLARACVDLAKDWRMDKYLRNLEAVSYTHLDVYKRQSRTCAPFWPFWPRPRMTCRWPHCCVCLLYTSRCV